MDFWQCHRSLDQSDRLKIYYDYAEVYQFKFMLRLYLLAGRIQKFLRKIERLSLS